MKQILINISSVAKYESKLLVRSWFFKIYIAIAAGLTVVGGMMLNDMSIGLERMTSLIPYALMLILNIIQSLIIIFMSSDYLKRDKQLDTSEVFYVRPLSNAEYLFGKVFGTMKPFLTLDLVLMTIVYVVCRFGFNIECSFADFFTYLFIVIIPSLIFFIGVSTALMLIIGNQAITYIALLGISWLSLFYTGSYMEYLFDMFMISSPLAKSDVLGISGIGTMLHARLIYVMVGVSAMVLSVYLFHRLASSKKVQNFFLMLSIAMFAASGLLIFEYTIIAYRPDRVAGRLIELNNEYSKYPRLVADEYDIDLEQLPRDIAARMTIRGAMSKSGSQLVFNLNGGLDVSEVTLGGSAAKPLDFEREEHLIIVNLGRTYDAGEELELGFAYEGEIDEDEMYIDIEDKNLLYKSQMHNILNYDKRTAYLEPEWVVLTPESAWYVRPGVSFSDEDPNWRQEYFSQFNLRVKPLPDMVPVSQGSPVKLADSVSYQFTPEEPLRALSLMISRYQRFSTTIEEREYSLYIHESNYNHIELFELIADTIPYIVGDLMGDYERSAEVVYSLPRLTLVDVPEHLYNYKREWSSSHELGQPELMLIPGAGASPMKNLGMRNYDVTEMYKNSKKYGNSRNRGQQTSDYDMRCNILRSVTRSWNQGDMTTVSYDAATGLTRSDEPNPHYLTMILFNSRYNIVSDSISWGNQLLEMYYMSFRDQLTMDMQNRNMVGMSDLEQVLLLLEKEGCNKYLADRQYSSFITEIIIAHGNMLFAEAISQMGDEEFTATLKELIESREYKNVNMDEFLDSISLRSGVDVRKNLENINKPFNLPYYDMGGLKTEMGYLYEELTYSTEVTIQNLSDYKGYVEVQYRASDGTTYAVVELEPKQIKRVVRHTTSTPSVTVNTMNSANIPQTISLGSVTAAASGGMMGGGMMAMMGGMGSSSSIASAITSAISSSSGGGGGGGMSGGGGGGGGGSRGGDSGGGSSGGSSGGATSMGSTGAMSATMSIGGMSRSGRLGVQEAVVLSEEGDFVVETFEKVPADEIIVDNEDEGLFTLSEAPTSGYLNTWIDQSIDTKVLYKSPNMRTSYKWSLISGQQFYGTSILSAWQIRKGDGSQFAEWKIPVERGQRYSITFSTYMPNEVSRSRNSRSRNQRFGNATPANQDYTYSFTIDSGDEDESHVKYDFKNMASSNSRSASIMWEWLGDFTARQDTIVVRLNNKSDIERINADAIKATIISKN